MNLLIAIMGDSYEMVKENEAIEALHERAKIIVDMELLYPDGMRFLGPHKYDQYLHVVTKEVSDKVDDTNDQPWEGITGRVKQETNRLMAEVVNIKQTADANAVAMDANFREVAEVKERMGGVESKLENIEKMLVALVESDRRFG